MLPAVPAEWPDGSFSGLVARGGFEISEKWQKGKLTFLNVESKQGGQCRIKYGANFKTLNTQKGKRYELQF